MRLQRQKGIRGKRNGPAGGRLGLLWSVIQRLSLMKALVALGTSGALFIVLFARVVPQRIDVKIGDKAPRDVIAEQRVRYRDVEATEKLRSEKQAEVDPVYQVVVGATNEAQRAVAEVFRRVREVRADPTHPDLSSQLEALKAGLLLDIGDANLSNLLRCDPSALPELEKRTVALVTQYMRRPIHDVPDDLPQVRAQIADEVKASSLAQRFRPTVIELAQKAVRVNRKYDEVATRAEKERRAAAVPWQYAELNPGELVLHRGEVVTEQDMSKLEALGLTNPKIDTAEAIALGGITVGIVALFGLY
ncbi:MAG: hypothetical protein ACE5O2_09010, partial [Armatimonadota bacterium]